VRNVFFDEFKEKFNNDNTLFFLTGDTGFNLVEPIIDGAPDRAINVGVAEQNMIGIASGLVNAGFVPVCYAITNFLIERCFEQIRNDICLHNYKVILVGTSTGYDNGALGATHHMLDDIGAVKVFPNLRIYSPSGNKSMSAVLADAFASKDASYIRISKTGIDEVDHVGSPNHFVCNLNAPVLVISHGKMISNALDAHKIFPKFSIFAMDMIKPLDDNLLADLFSRFKNIVVIEDNFSSGLFNSICEWVVRNNVDYKKIVPISPDESYDEIVGDPFYLEGKHGISPDKIVYQIRKIVNDL